MTKTQWIYLKKLICSGRISFIASILFVSLGIALYCAMSWGGSAIRRHTDAIYQEGAVHHFDLTFPGGIRDAALDELRALDGIASVEGSHASYESILLNGDRIQTLVISLTEIIDTPIIIEGTLPEKSNEIAAEAFWARKNNIRIGDTLQFPEKSNGILGSPCLVSDTFTVTALIENGVYINTSEEVYGISPDTQVPVNGILFVSPAAMDLNASNGYTHALILCDELMEYSTFSEPYKEAEKLLRTRLTEKAQELSLESWDELTGQFPILSSIQTAPGCAVSGRAHLTGYHVVTGMVNTFWRSRFALASVFVVVGFLVCYSSISRSVHAQSVQIGAMKAMGFSKKEICRLYYAYTSVIVVLGCLVGLLIGLFFAESALLFGIKGSFLYPDFKLYFGWQEAVFLFAAEALSLLLITRLTIHSVLKRPAVELLADTQAFMGKPRFYERFRLFQRLPLFVQIILNNCFHDTRRIIGTIIGVMSCTVLVVIPFLYKNLTLNNYSLQFSKSYSFDHVIYYDSNADGAREAIRSLLEKENLKHSNILFTNLFLQEPGGEVSAAVLFVPSDLASFQELVQPEAADADANAVWEGVWVSRALRDEYDLESAESLEYTMLTGETRQIKTTGYVNHYLNNVQLYMDSGTWQTEFGQKPAYNAFLVRSEGRDMDSLGHTLLEVDGFLSLRDYAASSKAMFEMINSLSVGIVFIYVSLAVAMAFLVLLNLLTMYVNEKKKELIILMINGYSVKYARRYIYSDTIVITVIGIFLGIVLGEILGNLAMSAFESNTLFYPITVDAGAAFAGAAVSSLLTLLMSLISLRRIPHLELADLNK